MTAEIVKIAEAITREMAAATFSQPFEPVRSYDTDTELADLDNLHVDVVPAVETTEMKSRRSMGFTCEIDIGIRKRFGPDATDEATGKVKTEEIDALMDLKQEILLSLGLPRLAMMAGAKFGDAKIRVSWVPAHLHDKRQYTGVIRATYQTVVDIA